MTRVHLRPNRKSVYLAGIGAALGLGVATGLLLSGRWGSHEPLRFEAPTIELSDRTYVEVEAIEVVSNLQNSSSSPITVTEIRSTCGCTAVGAQGRIELPLTLQPQSTLPLGLRIRTDGRAGTQSFWLQAVAQSNDGPSVLGANLEVVANIIAPLHAIPNMIYLTPKCEDVAAPLSCTIALADTWPEQGLTIKEIRSTAAKRFQYKLIPAHGELISGALLLKKRFDLKVSLTIPITAKSFRETVTIVPGDPKARSVDVLIHGDIVPKFWFTPQRLFFYGTSAEQELSRLLEYRFRDATYGNLVVETAPPGVRVEILPGADGVNEVRVSCLVPKEPGRRADDIVFRVGKEQEVVRIPVTRFHDGPRPLTR